MTDTAQRAAPTSSAATPRVPKLGQRPPLKSFGLRLIHTAVIVMGWALFLLAWAIVLRDEWDFATFAWVISVASIVSPLITLFWVRHNFAIFLEKGQRKGLPDLDLRYERDWNGNPVVADWPTLRQARLTVIAAEPDGTKRYSPHAL